MEKTWRDHNQETLVKLYEEYNDVNTTPERKKELINDIRNFGELEIRAMQIDTDIYKVQTQQDAEIQKAEIDARVEEAKRKLDIIVSGIECGTKILGFTISCGQLSSVMNFETTGSVPKSLIGWMIRPKVN